MWQALSTDDPTAAARRHAAESWRPASTVRGPVPCLTGTDRVSLPLWFPKRMSVPFRAKYLPLWEFTQAFGDGGRIIPDTFLYVSSQGEGISSSTGNLVFGTCQSLESIAVNFPRERSSYKWRKQHFFGVAVEFQAAKYPFSLTSLPVYKAQRKPGSWEIKCS